MHPEEGNKGGDRAGRNVTWGRAEDSGLSSFEKNTLRCDPIALCSFLRRGNGVGGAALFSLGSSDRTCGNGPKLRQGRFSLDMMKHWFYQDSGQALEQASQRGGR